MLNAKSFSERLNHCLDQIEAPPSAKERSLVLSKMLNISKHEALSFLEGHQLPNDALLNQMAQEFEVDPNWLAGK